MIREYLKEEGHKEGRKEGREEGLESTALNLLKMGMLTHKQIAEATVLPLSKIKKLAKQI